MKYTEVEFEYILPNDLELTITARLTPGRPEQGPTYDCGGEPEEPPECEIIDSYFMHEGKKIPFNVYGFKFDDEIEEQAFVAADEF